MAQKSYFYIHSLNDYIYTWESIAVVAWECVHDVFRAGCPGSDLPVAFDTVDQLWSAILQGQGVTMVLIQVLQHSKEIIEQHLRDYNLLLKILNAQKFTCNML